MATAEQNPLSQRQAPRRLTLDPTSLQALARQDGLVSQSAGTADFALPPPVAGVGSRSGSQAPSWASILQKRAFDLTVAITALPFLALPMLVIAAMIRVTSRGPALHWSARVGRRNQIFNMPKFRTMRGDTPQVASRHLENPDEYLTPLGSFLRKTSLDELPQIFSILRGDLSFVGPRPVLYNERELITRRTELGIHELLPGLTGWAQINGRDHVDTADKVMLDNEYYQRRSLWFDMKIMVWTVPKVIRQDGVSH